MPMNAASPMPLVGADPMAPGGPPPPPTPDPMIGMLEEILDRLSTIEDKIAKAFPEEEDEYAEEDPEMRYTA